MKQSKYPQGTGVEPVFSLGLHHPHKQTDLRAEELLDAKNMALSREVQWAGLVGVWPQTTRDWEAQGGPLPASAPHFWSET